MRYNTRQVSDWSHSPAPSQNSRERTVMDASNSTPLRRCTKCGKEYPATTDNFYRKERGAYGLFSRCKSCHNAITKPSSSQWNKDNPERAREAGRRFYQNHADQLREKKRRYLAEHPEVKRAKNHRRRARTAGAAGSYSTDDLAAIRAAQTDKQGRLRCWWCGKPIKGTPHLDHKIALAVGGSNDAGNLCYSCAPCNQSKSVKSPAEFAGRLF